MSLASQKTGRKTRNSVLDIISLGCLFHIHVAKSRKPLDYSGLRFKGRDPAWREKFRTMSIFVTFKSGCHHWGEGVDKERKRSKDRTPGCCKEEQEEPANQPDS